MPIGRIDYEEKKEAKVDRLKKRVEKNREEADQQFSQARKIAEAIPLGQPILVGHHSEKRHRADLKRMENYHRKSVEAIEKADYYEDKIDSIESNNSISGDDPEAISRYKEKLEKLETLQVYMKSLNAYWRKNKTMKGYPGFTDEEAAAIDEKMKTAYSWVQINGPCEDFKLKNNNAEIRRIKAKLETLSKLDSMEAETITFTGGEMRMNVEINRIQLIFDEKPSVEVRALLKSNGFHWSPSEKAWQRQRTLNAVKATKYLIPEIEEINKK